MEMADKTLSNAIDEILAVYRNLCNYHLQNLDDSAGISNQADTLLGMCLDHFGSCNEHVPYDISVAVFKRSIRQPAHVSNLEKEGIVPYTLPITRNDLLQTHTGMVPLLLMKVCIGMHKMPIHPTIMVNWNKFVNQIANVKAMPADTGLSHNRVA